MKNLYTTVLTTALALAVLLPAAGLSAQTTTTGTTDSPQADPTDSPQAQSAGAVERTRMDIDPSGDFVIGPGKTEVSVQPGESTTRQITVTNRTDSRQAFEVTLEDFTAAEGSGEVIDLLGDQRGPASLQDFLRPQIREFSLASGEQITFPVSVSVPATAEPGGRYGAVIISNTPEESTSGGATAQVVSRLASLFLVRVEGDVNESGQLTNFRVSGPSSLFWQDGPESFEVLFKNTGSVHLTPYGQITITNLFGQTVDTIPIDAYFALPDSTRYRVVENMSDSFRLGRYTAHLSLNRSYGNEVDTAQTSFWVIPWRILVSALLIILLISALVRWFTNQFELRRKGS